MNNNTPILIGCDHAAYDLKLLVIEHLKQMGYEPIDVGTHSNESCDYPLFAHRVCMGIREGKAALGILICGTGIGMSLVANKYKGIRAACCSDSFSARLTREHNDANVLCFGARVVGMGLAFDLVDNFLTATYMGDKHARRVAMIADIENGKLPE